MGYIKDDKRNRQEYLNFLNAQHTHFFFLTSSAIVFPYPKLVEASGVSNWETVIVGVYCLLAISHINLQLIASLSRNLVNILQTCMKKQKKTGSSNSPEKQVW